MRGGLADFLVSSSTHRLTGAVNWDQVRALVEAQLTLDLRHPKTGAARFSRAAMTVVSYGVSSLILAVSLLPHAAHTETVLFVGLSFATVLACFAVVGTYDDLMGRPRDHAWALTLPATEATHYVARLVNIGLFAGVVGVSTALPLAVLVGWHSGVAVALAAGGLFVAMVFGVVFAALAGIWGLTLALPPRALKPVLGAGRALLVGALVVGYQWIGTQSDLVVDAAWWPPSWVLGGLWLGSSAADAALLVALAAVLVACFSLVFPRRYFALFQRTAASEALGNKERAGQLAPNRWERLVVRAPEARAAFGLTVAALRSDRLMRGRVWPAALLAFLFGVFGWWQDGLGDLFVWGAQNVLMEEAVQMHLSVLVVLLFSAQTLVQALQFSAHERAAWVFSVLPMRSGRALQVGAQSALVFRVLLPLHAALALLLSLSMSPFHALLHAGFWLGTCALVTRVQALFHREPPLSKRSDRFSFAERFVPLFLSIPAAVAFLMLQVAAFASVPNAVLALAGMVLAHAALGRLPGLRLTRPALAWGSAPRPAEA
ncbi:MAG: hypothetical protein AAGI91_06835 [Bacteroidota bacterium]